MQHQITTNAKILSAIMPIIDDIRKDHGLTLIPRAFRIVWDFDRYVIRANCNGAALRDLVTALDRAGYLD